MINDQFDSSTDQGSIIVPLKNMLNEAHAIDIGKKVQAAKHQTRLAGGYTGNVAPFGYEKEEGNCHQLLIDKVSAKVVLEIYQLVAEGNAIAFVVRTLNERKELSPSDYEKMKQGQEINPEKQCKWSAQGIKNILQSQMYIGNMLQGKCVSINRVVTKNTPDKMTLVKNTHEAIVSDELFHEVQEKLKENSITSVKNKYQKPNLFATKIFCGSCGNPMYRKGSPNLYGNRFCYRCHTPYRIGTSFCDYSPPFKIEERDLLNILGNALNKQAEILLGKQISLVEKEIQLEKVKSQCQKKQKELDGEIRKNQKYLKSLYENLVTQVISKEDYASLKEEFENALLSCNRSIWKSRKVMTCYFRKFNR